MLRRHGPSARWFAATVLAFNVASPPPASAWVPDAWLTTRTKVALLTGEGTGVSAVDVDTVDARVSLHGTVRSAEARGKAEAIARSVPGVKDVRNFLQVVPPEEKTAVRVSDSRVRTEVEKKIRGEPRLRGTGIQVQSVNKGLVLLAGTARTEAEHLLAIRRARAVEGVRAVATEARISGRWATLSLLSHHELEHGGRGVLDVAGDLWMTAETKLALLADPQVTALDVNVDTRDGIVTLFGTVPSDAAKKAAGEDARRSTGVRRVENKLQVVPAPQRRTVARRDGELRDQVRQAISARQELKHSVVRVDVENGVVRLTGTVPTAEHRLTAATVARRVPGVRAVEQELRIRTMVERKASR
ncbi:MAG: BON domain-containing protein [Candidatus Binatia bacterium]